MWIGTTVPDPTGIGPQASRDVTMTTNHDYNTPRKGTDDWHVPLNENFEQIDADVEIRDEEALVWEYAPRSGAKFFATDTGAVYLGDGDDWQRLDQSGRNPSFQSVSAEQVFAKTAEADAVLAPTDGGAVASDREGEIARGTDVARVMQAALDKHSGGRIVQTGTLSLSESVDVDVKTTYDGLGNTIQYDGTGWAIRSQAPADDVGAAISEKAGIANLRLQIAGGASGLRLRDVTNNVYRNIQINGQDGSGLRVGMEITDENHWTEDVGVADVHVRGYTEAGIRIGSADYNCRFERLSMQTTANGAVGLDLTNDVVASAGGNVVGECVFDSVMCWHRRMADPASSPAIRFDTECRNLRFVKPQVHPEWGLPDVRVTSDAVGNVTFVDPVLPNAVDGDASGFTVREEPQTHLLSTVGARDGFGDGRPGQGRQGARTWSDAADCPVQQRPEWAASGDTIEPTADGVRVPSDELLVRTGVFTGDADWGWKIRYAFDEPPTSGHLSMTCWESADTGALHELRHTSGGGCLLREGDGSGNDDVLAYQSVPADDKTHAATAARSRGGQWELFFDGDSAGTGSEARLPQTATQFRVANRTDVPVTVRELRVGPRRWVAGS